MDAPSSIKFDDVYYILQAEDLDGEPLLFSTSKNGEPDMIVLD